MPDIQVRPFSRADRDQLTALVNAHIQAVVPGVSVSVNTGIAPTWEVNRWEADGTLPAPGVYGVPEQWPHVHALYERAGFVHSEASGSRHDGHTEIVLLATIDELPRPAAPPTPGLELGRALGVNGTRLYGLLGDKLVGYIEVDTNLAQGGRLAHLRRLGFCELTRTARGWTRHPDPAASPDVAVTPGPPA